MRISIVYTGPIDTANERRDFMLMLKYGLEANGHDVTLAHNHFDTSRLNIMFGTHNMTADLVQLIQSRNLKYGIINTETIDNDMLNYRPDKGDFKGAFIPLLQGAKFIWDVIPQNLEQYSKYGLQAHFLRWGYCPELEEIKHDKPKDLDFYFFGIMTPHRQEIIKSLLDAGFRGVAHDGVPYFVRNTFIERAKVCLNLIAKPEFRHVNHFRICYLANNRISTIAETTFDNGIEKINDTAGYFDYAFRAKTQNIPGLLKTVINASDEWHQPLRLYEKFKAAPHAKEILGKLLEQSLESVKIQRGYNDGKS